MDTIATCIENWIGEYRRASADPQLLFVSGAQGIGKSTALKQIADKSGGQILTLSLDDFYLTREERHILAQTIHLLFETRGPPGTHDLDLLNLTLDALLLMSETDVTALPVFNKRNDDREPHSAWRRFQGRPDIIIVEGWMMGVLPDADAPSAQPLNDIEATDVGGVWRRYQEDQLADAYAKLWDRADGFLHLDAPGFETVLDWRLEQERSNLGASHATLTDERTAWVTRFILHYERLTRRMLAKHRYAGVSLQIDEARNVMSVIS